MEKEINYRILYHARPGRWIYFLLFILAPCTAYSQGEIIKTYYDETHSVIKEYYRVKDLKSRIIDGEYQAYYANGKTKVTGSYIDNVPDGLWAYYYESGNIRMRGRLHGDASYGVWKYYFENGKPSMEGELKKGVREGKWKFYFESGLLKSEGLFFAGEKSGIWDYYYEDGSLKAQAYFNGKHSIYKEFYTSGTVKMKGFQYEGQSDSLWTYYYDNGKTQAEGPYKNGQKDGRWIFYNENGDKTYEGDYKNGEKNGNWVYYYNNGIISSEGTEISGKKEGYWKLYNSDGQFIGDGKFESGTGIYQEYHSNGNLKVRGNVIDGQNEGKWQYYYEDGTLEGECEFLHGEGHYTGFYPSGKVKMKGEIMSGKNVGSWELYEENGTLTGYYRPVYEEDKPVFKVIEKKSQDTLVRDNIKPQYYYKNRKIRYFTPVINEYRGIILASNPLGTIIGKLPLSIEYYNQERLGHEIQVSVLRQPFFGSDASVDAYALYKRGFDIAFRQKLYGKDKGFGMFYLANELRYTSVDHIMNAVDSASLPIVSMEKITASEKKYEYSFIIGNRWMQLLGEWMIRERKQKGITLDLYIGAGIGYRIFEKKYAENSYYDTVFSDLRQGKFSFSPRFGINLGYVF